MGGVLWNQLFLGATFKSNNVIMETIDTLTLGEIVRQNYKAADVLEKYSLDFCCNGNQSIEDACAARGIDPEQVRTELKRLESDASKDGSNDFNSWTLHALVDHIMKTHHAYVTEQTPKINAYLDKIARVHGSRHPELLEIRTIFNEVGGELAVHMKKEELMLFPFITRIERAKNKNESAESPLFKSVQSPVQMMMADHADEGEKFARIAALTGGYQTPADACNTYALTYELLKEFERDLHRHIHLENNILFPRSIEMEAELKK